MSMSMIMGDHPVNSKHKAVTQDEELEMRITTDPNRRRALVCAGGGAKGIFQAKIIKELIAEGVRFDIVTGISAGTLNATQVAIGRSQDLINLWNKVDKSTLFGGGFNWWRGLQMLLGIKESVFDHDGIYSLLRKEYAPAQTQIPLIVGAVNYHNAEYVEFEIPPHSPFNEYRIKEVYKAIAASTSIPLLFPPVKGLSPNPHHAHGDGGMRNLTPLSPIISRDVDEIVVITNTPRHMATTREGSLETPIDYMKRGFEIVMNEMLREDIDTAMRVNRFLEIIENHAPEHMPTSPSGRPYQHVDISLIEPQWDLGDLLNFDPNKQQERLEQAEAICQLVLPQVDKQST